MFLRFSVFICEASIIPRGTQSQFTSGWGETSVRRMDYRLYPPNKKFSNKKSRLVFSGQLRIIALGNGVKMLQDMKVSVGQETCAVKQQ